MLFNVSFLFSRNFSIKTIFGLILRKFTSFDCGNFELDLKIQNNRFKYQIRLIYYLHQIFQA